MINFKRLRPKKKKVTANSIKKFYQSNRFKTQFPDELSSVEIELMEPGDMGGHIPYTYPQMPDVSKLHLPRIRGQNKF